MKKRKDPFVPQARSHTLRREIISLLQNRHLSARALSSLVGIPEKEVTLHLEHIRKSLGADAWELAVTPARCRACGFLFRKRERLSKPGRCPVCHQESIEEPLFSIGSSGRSRHSSLPETSA
jgi:hypothetical protein